MRPVFTGLGQYAEQSGVLDDIADRRHAAIPVIVQAAIYSLRHQIITIIYILKFKSLKIIVTRQAGFDSGFLPA